MSENKAKIIEQKAKEGMKQVKALFEGYRQGLGFAERPRWREIVKKRMNRESALGNNSESPNSLVTVKERFSNRQGGFLQGFFSREQLQPQQNLSPDQIQVLEEHKRQMQEGIEKRQAEEDRKQKMAKDAEDLKKAKERLSISV